MRRCFLKSFALMSMILVLPMLWGNTYGQVKVSGKVEPLLVQLYHSLCQPKETKAVTKGAPYAHAPISALNEVINLRWNSGEPIVSGYIVTNGGFGGLESMGVNVRSRIGNIRTADIALSKLPEIVELPNVKYIYPGLPVELYLNVSDGMVRGSESRRTFCETGKGVVIGIVDLGIDVKHPDFKNNSNETRILYLWEQEAESGSPPSGYDYGREWTNTEIDANPDDVPVGDHGTWVAGIAAGNGRAASQCTYVGMAPEADLIVVDADLSDHSRITDGVEYIGNKATNLGKPWVVNLSLGYMYGPKDGTSPFEQILQGYANNTFLGQGRIIVVSAGNEGYDASNPECSDPNRERNWKEKMNHASRYGGDTWVTMEVLTHSSSEVTNEWVGAEIWYPASEVYEITITSPSGRTYGPFGPGDGTGEPGYGDLWFEETDGLVGCHNVHFTSDPFPFTQDNQIQIELIELVLSLNI